MLSTVNWETRSSNFWKAARVKRELSQLLPSEGLAKLGHRSLHAIPNFLDYVGT